MKFRKVPSCVCYIVPWFLLMIGPHYVYAGNGLNVIGFGHESLQMGGADIAVARDTSALSTNPAGLSQIKGSVIDLNAVYINIDSAIHSDQFGNNTHPENSPIYGLSAALASEIPDTRFSWGAGLFTQGGAGVEYRQLNTPYSTVDELSSLLLIVKATTGVAYTINENLAIGASLSFLHSKFDQKIFPNTSVSFPSPPGSGFFGQQIDDATANEISAKIGLLYQLAPAVKLGIAYTSSSKLEYSGDRLIVNFGSIGLGKTTYNSVTIKGRRQPQELGVGVFFESTDDLHIAFEVNWIDWSSAMNTSLLSASDPDNMFAPAVIRQTIVDNWRDQLVLAAGLVYQLDANLVMRGGFNFARNPIPDEHLVPYLATIIEKHLTFGLGYSLSSFWVINAGIQLDLKNEATSTNVMSVTGPGSKERISAQSILLTSSYRW